MHAYTHSGMFWNNAHWRIEGIPWRNVLMSLKKYTNFTNIHIFDKKTAYTDPAHTEAEIIRQIQHDCWCHVCLRPQIISGWDFVL